jgi:very-short-patch-repair endonuclease
LLANRQLCRAAWRVVHLLGALHATRALGGLEWREMHPDRRVMAVAGRQHGCVSLPQLLSAGLRRRAVAHRVERGVLRRLHRGVYLVGPLEAPLSRFMAAVLAVGDGAVLSHASAAAVWELMPLGTGTVDVTVAASGPRSRPGIRVHRVRNLPADDAARHRNLPLTSPARTLLDLAATLPSRDVARAVETAEQRRLTTHAGLTHHLTRFRASRGAAHLRAALRPTSQLTRSEAERRFLALVREARLPPPAANTRVGGHEVDFLWPAKRLIVEIDGYAFHSTRAAFERDRVRDADLHARGYRVLRITPRRLVDEPAAVVAAIAAG